MKQTKIKQRNIYRIKVKEILDPAVTDWFDGMTITSLGEDGTLLTGSFPDQSALRGLLDQLWNRHFTVVSVEKVGNGFHQGTINNERKKK